MEVQIFGIRKSADTRAALRFFAERRIKTHFVNFDEHDGHRLAAMGLKAALEKLSLEPLLLRMPLVRWQHQLTIGPAEETWTAWCRPGSG